jgi:hypothetical protein
MLARAVAMIRAGIGVQLRQPPATDPPGGGIRTCHHEFLRRRGPDGDRREHRPPAALARDRLEPAGTDESSASATAARSSSISAGRSAPLGR